MLKIGSHVSLKADNMFLGSVMEALDYNETAFMVYTGAPQNTIRKPINELKIKEAHELMKNNNLLLENVVIHAPYIMNLANPSLEKREFGINFLTEEIKRSAKMGATQIVLHPGSAVGSSKEEAIKWIAEGVNKVISNTKGLNVKIALETMAGKGNEIGRTFAELKQIIDLITDKKRISVCFDTCHTHDSGYDIKNNFLNVIKEFDEIIGINYISVVHINDSKNEMGAKKDRHENLGYGYIGFAALIDIIYYEKFKDIPKILETPFVNDLPPYKKEIEMIRNKKFENWRDL